MSDSVGICLDIAAWTLDFDFNSLLKQHTKVHTKHKLLKVSHVEMLSAQQISDWVCTCSVKVLHAKT